MHTPYAIVSEQLSIILRRKLLTSDDYRLGREWFDVFAERHEIRTTVLRPGAVNVAEIVAITQSAQNRRRATLVTPFSTASHFCAVISGQVVGDAVVGRHDLQGARKRHHRCRSHRDNPIAFPVPCSRHLKNENDGFDVFERTTIIAIPYILSADKIKNYPST